jgi:hypothetical protein
MRLSTCTLKIRSMKNLLLSLVFFSPMVEFHIKKHFFFTLEATTKHSFCFKKPQPYMTGLLGGGGGGGGGGGVGWVVGVCI